MIGRLAGLVLLAAALPVAAQDELGVAAVAARPGQVRDVAVAVRDVAGTLLDEGDGFNLEIQGFAFRLDFAPASAVSAVAFVQAGVTAGHTALFPVVSIFPDHVVVLMSFDETEEPLTFTLNAAAPGDLIGRLRFTLAGSTPPGTLVTLTLAAATATLVNGAATLSETVANGHLRLTHGSILVDPVVFADGFESGDTTAWSAVVGG